VCVCVCVRVYVCECVCRCVCFNLVVLKSTAAAHGFQTAHRKSRQALTTAPQDP